MSLNGISTATSSTHVAIDTKIYRHNLKLNLAQTKRQSSTATWHRVLNIISGTHVAYVSISTATVSGTVSPTIGHPWTLGV